MAKNARLRFRHLPPGYEAWKDDRKRRSTRWGFILALLTTFFGCGAVATGLFFVPWQNLSLSGVVVVPTEATLPTTAPTATVITVEVITAPTLTPTVLTPTVLTPTVTPSPTATFVPKVNSEEIIQEEEDHQETEEILIWCEGAPFQKFNQDTRVAVIFDRPRESSLNFLDQPRKRNITPTVMRLVYHGYHLRVLGEAICGEWKALPVAYYPVELVITGERGWVGFGHDDDVWLRAINE